jgi:hypothetical protein
MVWVKGRYYQLSVWVNGKVETRYGGRGELAHALAELYELDRRDRREAHRLAREREAEQRALHRGEQARGRLIRDLVAVAAESAGFVKYAGGRGKWRKRRMGKAQTPARPSAPPDLEAEIRRVVADCKGGMPGALGRPRELGRDHPAEVIAATGADLFTLATQALLKVTCGDKGPELAALKEGLVIRLEQLTTELAGVDPSPVRRLVARAAAFDEMSLWFLQLLATNAGDRASSGLIRRLNAGHRRMMSSSRTLSQIARLETPRPRAVRATQINITAAAPAIGELPAFPGKP